MKIVIKTKNIKLNLTLKNLIEEKINQLEKFSKIFYSKEYFNHFFGKGKPKIEAWLDIGRESSHHQKGPVFFAQCQMRFPKRSLRATAQRENLESAIVEVKDELQRQLKQYKEKLNVQTKRRIGVLKKKLKLSSLVRLNFFSKLGRQTKFHRKGKVRKEGR